MNSETRGRYCTTELKAAEALLNFIIAPTFGIIWL